MVFTIQDRGPRASHAVYALVVAIISALILYMIVLLSFCLLAEKLLPFSYSQSPSIAIYTLGVVANITIAMHKSGECESVELVEAVKMVTEVCLLSVFIV